MAALAAATAELTEAGRRQAEIDRVLDEKKKQLQQLHDSHKRSGGGTGSGRWKKADQKKKDKLEAQIKRLESGKLPGDTDDSPRRTVDELLSGARANPQHHARCDAAATRRDARDDGAAWPAADDG